MSATDICVVGMGGVGGYFGFKLAQRFHGEKEVNITFIARNETYEAIRSKGLILASPEIQNSNARPDSLLSSVSDLPHAEILLLCVKAYDLEAVCLDLKEKVKENTVILPLMNGVDIYERIRNVLTKGIVLPSCVYVASHIREKGTIAHQGNPGRIIVGKDPNHAQYKPTDLLQWFVKAGIHMEYREDSLPDIWEKFYFIAGFGLVTARYNKSIGQVNEDQMLNGKVKSIMEEIGSIAAKKGIALPDNMMDLTFRKSALFPYHAATSLQLDIQAGKPLNELEVFAGPIIDYGKELGVPVPGTARIYTEIKANLSHLWNKSLLDEKGRYDGNSRTK